MSVFQGKQQLLTETHFLSSEGNFVNKYFSIDEAGHIKLADGVANLIGLSLW